jgi:hypothetical protein
MPVGISGAHNSGRGIAPPGWPPKLKAAGSRHRRSEGILALLLARAGGGYLHRSYPG